MSYVDIQEVHKFWRWFSEKVENFENPANSLELLDELDRRIDKLGNFSWEIGPGKAAANALVISPGGNPDLLPITKMIVEQATACEGWEYYYAKPPKEGWDLFFRLENDEGKMVDVNASGWNYRLVQYEDGTFDIIIQTSDLKDFTEKDKETAAEILLDGLIGEEFWIETIFGIEFVDEFAGSDSKKANIIQHLGDHLRSLKN